MAETCDIGIIFLMYPASYHDTCETIVPTVAIRNHGPESTGFMTWIAMLNPESTQAYCESLYTALLEPESVIVLEFPLYNFGYDSGGWLAYCSTFALGDIDSSNDVLSKLFTVGPRSSP